MFLAHHYRYAILAIGFLCLTSICSNYMVINFTFICMTADEEDVIDVGNGTYRQRYEYSPQEKSMIIWAVAVGTILGTFPINWAYVRFGARYPFFTAGILSAFSTGFTPWSAHLGLPVFLFFRLIQGLAFAADFAAVGVLAVRWAPLAEVGIFLGFLTSFTPVAGSITNALSGAMCSSSLGWRSIYYINAVFGLIVSVLWLILYSDDPQKHPFVSEKELKVIQKGKTQAHIERDSFVPYVAIIKNKTILVIWFNAFTELVAVVGLLTYAPLYFNKVLGYDISTTAVLTTLVPLSHLPFKLVCAFFSDYITYFSEITKMNFFNTIAVGGPGIVCGLLGFVPEPWMGVVGFGLCSAFCGANSSGYYKCGTLHSRQYAHFVLATIQFTKCASLFVNPGLAAIFLRSDSDIGGWRIIFLINCAFMLAANFLFYPFCTDQPAQFTEIVQSKEEEGETPGGILNSAISSIESR